MRTSPSSTALLERLTAQRDAALALAVAQERRWRGFLGCRARDLQAGIKGVQKARRALRALGLPLSLSSEDV